MQFISINNQKFTRNKREANNTRYLTSCMRTLLFSLMLKNKNMKIISLSHNFFIYFPQFCHWWHLSSGVKGPAVRRQEKLALVCQQPIVRYEGELPEVNVLVATESAVFSCVNVLLFYETLSVNFNCFPYSKLRRRGERKWNIFCES